jgi:hypothetical protein
MRVVQRGLVNLVIAVMGLALLADLAAW